MKKPMESPPTWTFHGQMSFFGARHWDYGMMWEN